MSVEALSSLFVRDLNKAAEEVEKYDSDDSLWTLAEGIGNSGGNLALHLSGNINHFIGAANIKIGRNTRFDASHRKIPGIP